MPTATDDVHLTNGDHLTNGEDFATGNNEVNGIKSTLKDIDDPTPLTATNGVHEHPTPEELDVVVVGAGFAGIYLLYQLRKRGFNAKIVEAGSNLGGVWHWNTYPGARVDSIYPIYAFSLPEAYEDWTWSCHYPDQPELQRYFEHVGKKLDIYKDTVLNTKVTAADFNKQDDTWTVHTDTGKVFKAPFFITSVGFMAKRYFPAWEGLENYKGILHHSSFWPSEGVDVKGKKVGVIGTGSTGVQIICEWAKEIGAEGDMKVFQRTPNLCLPMNQQSLTIEEQEQDKKKYHEIFSQRLKFYAGWLFQYQNVKTFDHTPEERRAFYEEQWKKGGFRFLMNSYSDLARNVDANQEAYSFWREKTRHRVKDPKTAKLLVPDEPPHPFGAKRLALENGYFELFNEPNIHVVDVKTNKIARFEPEGIRLADGTLHELDVVVVATGFDGLTGGLKDIAIRGRDGELLSDKWNKGTWTYLGLATAGFPNLFFTYGPQAPTVYANGPSITEPQGEYLAELLDHLRSHKIRRIEAEKEAEQNWRALVNELSKKGLRHYTPSWYNGANVPGKPVEALNYAGGLPTYLRTIAEVRDEGYKGFKLISA